MINKTTNTTLAYTLLLITNILTAIIYNLCNEIPSLILLRLGAALINGIGFTLLSIIFIELINRFTKINLILFFLVTNCLLVEIELFLLHNFYTIITPSVISVINGTNSLEIVEFINSYLNTKVIFLLIISLLPYLIIYKYRYLINKILNHLIPIKQKNKIIIVLSFVFSYLLFNFYVTKVRKMTSYQSLTPIERLYYSLKNTKKDEDLYEEYLRSIKKPSPKLIENNSSIKNIVLILGESLSKFHMNAYGYYLNTTPYLNERLKNHECILMQNARTPKTTTTPAIKEIMTFYEDNSKNAWFTYYTIMEILKTAGYKTYWLSNQESFSLGENNSTKVIAQTADSLIFTHERHATEERYGYFDDALIPLLNNIIKTNISKKTFYCLHLMGSHSRYTNRYPQKFNVFNEDDIKKDISKYKKQTIAEYDNSVYFNDYVVNNIIKSFENEDAIVFYFPDHGEEVYDTRNMFGHELYNPSLPMKNIPFVIWTSNIFKTKHTDIQERLNIASKKQINTKDFIHSLLDISNIKTSNFSIDKSFFYEYDK